VKHFLGDSLSLLIALIAADALLLIPPVRYPAALMLLLFLPGWAWLPALASSPLERAERLLFAIGLSFALTIFGTMFALYLPGPLTATHLLVMTNLLILAGIVWQGAGDPSPSNPLSHLPSLILLLLVILLAAALRLPRLGYAEFHEDEAEMLMLGVRVVAGEDYALFLHRKGPAQMLLPVALWVLGGQITEATARFPFALSSILSAATLFVIGRRWWGWRAGLTAGLLWAVNGYAIAFGRMTQYQAIIFFLGPLAIYALYLAGRERRPGLQIVAAILLAACLLAHFDALLLLPAVAYLGWLILFRPPHHSSFITHHSLIALTLFFALLAAFYVPYVLDPEFSHTTAYLAESRVKPGLLYNNLNLLRRLDKDYSSPFYLPVLAVGLATCVGRQVWHKWPALPRSCAPPLLRPPAPLPLLAALGLTALSTVWLPGWWQAGAWSLAVVPWVLLGLLCFGAAPTVEAKIAWVMFGAPFVGYLFLVEDPRTHLYILYPGAVLLAAAGLGGSPLPNPLPETPHPNPLPRGEGTGIRLTSPPGDRREEGLLIAVLLILCAGVIFYEGVIFLQTETALTQTAWDGTIWETLYDDLPKARTYFGYPKREGWKAIGALRTQGLFPGDFRSVNEEFIIPIWYNYGQARSCYETPTHFFVRAAGNEETPELPAEYSEVARIEREGEVRLHIFSAGPPAETITTYALEALEADFDRQATPAEFIRQAEPTVLRLTQFGPAIELMGYDLPANTIAPGETLHLNLYWHALRPPDGDYRAFVHLTDGTILWAQQDETPACRLPTSLWREGQRSVGQFRLAIPPETPPGRYAVIIGLYHAERLERLKITASATDQPGDDFLWIGDVEVTHSRP
jgi:hypothetical protein